VELTVLNNLPPSVSPVPGRSAEARPILHRRRGGQPANPNALKHGLYAVRNQTPFTSVSTFAGSYRQILDKSLNFISQTIPELQEKIVLAFQLSEKAKDTSSLLSWLRLLTKMINFVVRLKIAWYKLQQPEHDLHFVAQHAITLILHDFRSQGITRDADLFREKRELSDFNSLPGIAKGIPGRSSLSLHFSLPMGCTRAIASSIGSSRSARPPSF